MVSLLFGSVGALFYSLAGAVLSLAVMTLLRRLDVFSPVGVSVAGGVSHNVGQILMAMVLLETERLIWYLPVLILTGLGGGILVGLCGAALVKRIPPLEK